MRAAFVYGLCTKIRLLVCLKTVIVCNYSNILFPTAIKALEYNAGIYTEFSDLSFGVWLTMSNIWEMQHAFNSIGFCNVQGYI